MNWLYSEFTKISTTLIFLTQIVVHAEDIADRFTSLFKLKTLYERRHTAMFKYLKLIPLFEKLAADLEAAAKSPEDQAVAADVRALIAQISADQAPAPVIETEVKPS